MGSLKVKYGEKDWGNTLVIPFLQTMPLAEGTYEKNLITYHQSDVHNCSCVLHAGLTVLSNYWGREIDVSQRKTMREACLLSGLSKKTGTQLCDGVDYLRERWNAEFRNKEVNTYRFKANSLKTEILLNLGYMGHTGRRLYGEYTDDLRDDGVLNSVTKPPKDAGYHAMTIHKIDGDITVVNSYKNWTSQPNEYKVEYYYNKVRNGVFIDEVYFYLPTKLIRDKYREFKNRRKPLYY